jgi:DnaJ family protein B protein 4
LTNIDSQKPHLSFAREKDNLRYTVEISFIESLTGWTRSVPLIDGRYVKVVAWTPTGPEWTELYPGLGMPSPKDETIRGDLIIGVKISYPRTLSALQKQSILMSFGNNL